MFLFSCLILCFKALTSQIFDQTGSGDWAWGLISFEAIAHNLKIKHIHLLISFCAIHSIVSAGIEFTIIILLW